MRRIEKIAHNKQFISIGLIWLFTLSGMIGMSSSYYEWFVTKTPTNLLLLFILLVIHFPILSKKTVLLSLLFFSVGFFAEWLGVHYGFLFGQYHYGENLGVKFLEIPLLIGVNWVLLTLTSAAISQKLTSSRWIRAILGALLMVILDFLIEPSAPKFDFWYFDGGHAPLQNFIAWFGISFLLHLVYVNANVKGNSFFSAHLFGSQVVFFLYFLLTR